VCLAGGYQRFEGTYTLHIQGRRYVLPEYHNVYLFIDARS
jgi:hypothetical protein